MDDYSLETTIYPGAINIEPRTDGGIGICVDASQIPHGTLMLTRQQTMDMIKWLVIYVNQEK